MEFVMILLVVGFVSFMFMGITYIIKHDKLVIINRLAVGSYFFIRSIISCNPITYHHANCSFTHDCQEAKARFSACPSL
jgi:hypothetical protein